MEELDLSYNRLTGSIPTTIGNLSKLRILSIAGADTVDTLGNYGNQLTGTIPTTITNLDSLRRLELSGKGASLSDLQLITVFQHNMYALPQLMLGKNRVRVAVANPEALEETRLLVEYAWDQDGKTRKLRRRVRKSPAEFVVEVPGKELPRMRYLSLINAGSTREGKSNPAHE